VKATVDAAGAAEDAELQYKVRATIVAMTPSPPPTATPLATERDFLTALYESTDGDNWKNNRHWGTVRHRCSWHGVTCIVGGAVTRLRLTNNNLTGSIPSALGNLSYLEDLRLDENNLRGRIPIELGNLRHLEYLQLQGNNLTDTIPPKVIELCKKSGVACFWD
jgi:Leucine-rich repeat (LRR) protein